MSEELLEAVVIGSGFGGAINACRLGAEWPGKVLVLERGKRYPLGSFPRSPDRVTQNFWNIPVEKQPWSLKKWWEGGTAIKELEERELHGLFDVRSYGHMDVVMSAGLGGGSLIYANVFLFPPREIFDDERWPKTCTWEKLHGYYEVAKQVLCSRTLPGYDPEDSAVIPDDPRRRVIRTELFRKVAKTNGRRSRLAEINVFFGKETTGPPLTIGHQDCNRYGARQTSCVYCGECMIGCNYHAKNTLDLNYLYAAEHFHGTRILTGHVAEVIVPLSDTGKDDPNSDGSHGYRIYYWNLAQGDVREQRRTVAHYSQLPSAVTKRVVVSAGSLGSTELLLRNKLHYRTLTRVSDRLGSGFSGNGDFLSFAVRSEAPVEANYGPVITQYIDYNLYENFDRERAFLVEDAAFPSIMGWFVEGFRPAAGRIKTAFRPLINFVKRWTTGRNSGQMGGVLRDALGESVADKTVVFLDMGVDRSDGTMRLGYDNRLRLDWPYRNSMPLYRAILEAGVAFSGVVWARFFVPLLTWSLPFRRNATVHPLGGCILAADETRGVTNSALEHFGEVFGYTHLYVADGAVVPTAVGSNPTASISALSEMVAEGITRRAPTPDLTTGGEAKREVRV
jgi:cholesterol oxidase